MYKVVDYTMYLKTKLVLLISLAQLIKIIHNICNIFGSNPDHPKKLVCPRKFNLVDNIYKIRGQT